MKRSIILSILFLFALLTPEIAKAQIEKWADDKYGVFLTCLLEKNNYDDAKAELEKLSEQGDAQARCCLGAMLCFGEKEDRDYARALELLKQAASSNYERAEYLLGAFGSMERSREFLRAITGDDSMIDIADDNFWKQCFKYSNSEIVTFKDAFNWFLMKDGNWGYRDIMYYCAVQYLNGSYGVVDVQKAIKWLNRSKDLGNPDAEELLEQINEAIRKH